MKFTHLHVHSHYSLLDGLAKIPELVKRTAELGMDALALTDHGVMYGAIEFYKTCRKHNIKPIIGQEFYVASGSLHDKQPKVDEVRYHLILLCENNTGYQNLIKLTTAAHLDGFYYKPRVDKELLKKYSSGLIALSGCLSGEVAKIILSGNLEKAENAICQYQEIFGHNNFFLEISHHPNIKENTIVNEALIKLSQKLNAPLVATQDVHYLNSDDKEAQDILMAVQTGAKLDQDDRPSLKIDDFSLRSPEEMNEFFKNLPQAIENTQLISQRCCVELNLNQSKLPYFEVPADETPNSFLEKLCYKGLKKRYGDNISPEIKSRLNYELEIIQKTGFVAYFLIVQDFVNWAKSQGIVVGPGRGSAPGSLVSYALNITNIDPIKYNLIFERFLNPDRISMPDIDLDFTDTRRDEVIEYVAQKYGRDKVAQIITFGTMAARAAIRDAGRAMGLPYSFCDHMAKIIPFNTTLSQALATTELKQLYETDPQAKHLLDAAKKLEGVARHASTHACGVVITKEPLNETVPLQYASRDDKTIVTQYEMHAIEDLGLLKMDFLGLKNLTIIERTLELIQELRNIKINIDNIALDDAAAFKLLQQAKTTGVFQLESSGMKRYLKELKPTELEDIIAMVSLYRPGPMELIPTYIKRKHGQEPITYLHPKLEPILKNTYGIMVYQEQLMAMTRELAGLTLAEADTFRRAVGKKIKSLLLEQRAKLISGMAQNGVDLKTAEAIWALVEPFARYGFNRSHGASYAMIAYQTAYLKANYPQEFMCALLNSESADIERISFLISEAKDFNLSILPPDINESFKDFTLAPGKNNVIRFGLEAIKNVGTNVVESLIAERQSNGPFKNITDVLSRIESRDLNKKSLESLIKTGALDSLGERNEFLTNLDHLLNFSKEIKQARLAKQTTIFDDLEIIPTLKLKSVEPAEMAQKLIWEKELLGLYLSDHPLSPYKDKLEKETQTIKTLLALEASGKLNRSVKVGGMLNRSKKIITKTGRPMIFAQLQDFADEVEIVVFPDILEKNPALWQTDRALIVQGRAQMRDGSLKIICQDATLLE